MNFIFILLIGIKLLAVAVAFECYQCNSQVDKFCASTPHEKYLKKCELTIPKSSCLSLNTTSMSIDPVCKEVKRNQAACHAGHEFACENLSQEISIESTLCRKITSRVHGQFISYEGDTKNEKQQIKPRVTRQCGYIRNDVLLVDNQCTSKRNGGSHQLSCSCENSACNGAQHNLPFQQMFISSSLSLLTSTAILFYLMGNIS